MSEIKDCNKCLLSKTRTNIVWNDGPESAKLMLVGEAPGADEDKQGKPFVGRAGKLLNELLKMAQIDREKDLYIANTVKCRPPENRKPTREEKEACRPYLDEQIKKLNPKVVILCGATAMESFLPPKLKISKVRGEVFEVEGRKYVPIFHPSFLLRNHSKEPDSPRSLTVKDLIFIKELLS